MRKAIAAILIAVLLISALVGSMAAGLLPDDQQGPQSEHSAMQPTAPPSLGSVSNRPEPSEATYPKPYLDLDYDDSWVANVPEVIGGYTVIRVTTPKTVVCSGGPIITFHATQKSLDEFLSAPPDLSSLRAAVRSIPGVPSDVRLSFAGKPRDDEEYAESRRRSNESMISSGCIFLGRPIITGLATSVVPGEDSRLSDSEHEDPNVVRQESDNVGTASTEDPEHESPNVVRQDPDSNPSPDSAIIAAETGLPVDQIEKAIAFQNEFSAYAGELKSSFPGQISAIWMDSPLDGIGPNTRGNIRFVGEVPSEAMFKENVLLTGGGNISMEDHKRRSEIAAGALLELGYTSFIAFFAVAENVIVLELGLMEGASQPSKPDIVAAIQDRAEAEQSLQGRAAVIEESDVSLRVLTGSASTIQQPLRGPESEPDGMLE